MMCDKYCHLQLITYNLNYLQLLKMERINYTNILHTLLIVLLSGMMWSCADDGVFDIPTHIESGKRVEGSVIVSLKIPAASSNPTTRSNSLSANDANAINEIEISANVTNAYPVNENVTSANVLNEIEINAFNIDEDAVSEIAMLLFDSNGYTYQPLYIGGDNMVFNADIIESFSAKVPLGTYNMVILANANHSLSKALQNNKIKAGDSKADVLKQLLFSNPYDDTSDSHTIAKWDAAKIPMWGEALDVQVSGDGPVSVGVIELVRMVAKIDVQLTATAATNFTLKSVRLYNYNTLAQVAPNSTNWGGEPSIPVSPGKVKGPLVYTATDATSCTNKIYTFEAKAGSVNSLSSNTSLVVGVTKKSDNKTTYHRIDFVNETVYLDLKRNHHYKVNIADIKSQGHPNPNDAFDLPSIQPEANSYIVTPNGPGILIPVSRAGIGANTAFSAVLVWTDNSKGIAPTSNIKEVSQIGTGSSGYIVVKPGSASGNALVAIKNSSGTIIWSWHIWVTDYKPSGTFMDRNLGAIGNTPGNTNTFGLLYQWGRKDPFPGNQSLYNASGAVVNISTDISVLVGSRFAKSFENPTTYYAYSIGGKDWIGPSISHKDDELWGRNTTTQTVYDPCPAGWRVPKDNIWIGMNIANSPWNDNNKGIVNNSYGGFYPAAGARLLSNDGIIDDVGKRGYYWSASVNGYQALDLYFHKDGLSFGQNVRSNAYSVRCVKE